MPVNLNALIRYKIIDTCLQNRRYGCTLEELRESCTEALQEERSDKITISTRTIQDDIRVLRGDTLGFNAPIINEDGKYKYSNSSYFIGAIPLSQKMQLQVIYNELIEAKKNKDDIEIDDLIKKIGVILGNRAPEQENSDSDIFYNTPPINGLLFFQPAPDYNRKPSGKEISLVWGDVFKVLEKVFEK